MSKETEEIARRLSITQVVLLIFMFAVIFVGLLSLDQIQRQSIRDTLESMTYLTVTVTILGALYLFSRRSH